MRWMSYPLALLFLCLTVHLGATTYYLDKTGGDNSKDGLSLKNAWQDYFKVRASVPQPGDTFLFKRGEVWDSLQMYITHSGAAGNPIVYGAYGDPSDPLPIISGNGPLDGANDTGNWDTHGANIWRMSMDRTPGRLFLDNQELLRASTLGDLGQQDPEGATGKWFWNATTDSLYLVSAQNPALAFTEIRGSVQFEAAFQIRSFGLPGTVKDHLIRNNIIYETGQDPDDGRYAVGTGIELYDPDTTGVGGNTFQNNLFYNSLSDTNFVFVRDSTAHYSVSEFNALNGVDTNSISGNIFGDPLFTDLANGDYPPPQGSPAIDAALDLGYALDYDQMPRLAGAAPDIGPFETNYPDPCVPIEGDSLVAAPIVLAAMDSIRSGTYSSLDTLDLTGGTVYSGDYVVMRAREHLVFKPGFSAEAGAAFTAQVADLCGPVELIMVEEPAQVPPSHIRPASRNTLRVAPNPATSNLQASFTLSEEGPVRLTLINLQGQTVQRVFETARQTAGEYQMEIPLGQQRTGLYVLMLEQNGDRGVQRVVVQGE